MKKYRGNDKEEELNVGFIKHLCTSQLILTEFFQHLDNPIQ